MDFGKLVKGVLGSSGAKKIVGKAAKEVTKKSGLNLSSLVGVATKNSDVVSLLGKIGALKNENEPEDTVVQKMVQKLYTLVSKTVGVKIDETMFSKIVTKIISSDAVKKKIEKLSKTTGATTFIKKAISSFIG